MTDVTLKTKKTPVYLLATVSFSYNGMIDKGQYFESRSLKDARALVAQGLAEEVTKEQADKGALAQQSAAQGLPWDGTTRAVTASGMVGQSDDWTNEEDDTAVSPEFQAAIAAADTHAALEAAYTEQGLTAPARGSKTLADRKKEALG